MKKIFRLILVFLLVGLAGLTTYLIGQSSLQVDDTDALFGGRLEFGYTSAGYLINLTGESTRICGFSALSPDTGVTAAHCVDDAEEIFIGKNQFTPDTGAGIKVIGAIQKDGWVQEKQRVDDFAVLKFNSTNYFNSYAQVATPIEGCFYRVVAYGRTENEFETVRQRKSSKLCAFDLQRDTFKIRGDDSGICFGDSGSPLYFDGTNKIVGVIVSIVLENQENDDPCSFGNTAVVVRTDVNNRLIQENIQNPPDSSAFDPQNKLTIDVAQETLLERLGLERFQNMTEREKTITYLVIIFVVIIFLIILTILLLLKPQKKQQ